MSESHSSSGTLWRPPADDFLSGPGGSLPRSGGPAPWPPFGWHALHFVWKYLAPRAGSAPPFPLPPVAHATTSTAAMTTTHVATRRDNAHLPRAGTLPRAALMSPSS